jgi:hypothetical protein
MVLEHRARMEARPLMASAVDVLKVGMSTNHAACGGQYDFLKSFELRDEVVDVLSSPAQFNNVYDFEGGGTNQWWPVRK